MEISRRLFCVFYPLQFWNVYELVFLDFFVCFKFCQIKQTNKQTHFEWKSRDVVICCKINHGFNTKKKNNNTIVGNHKLMVLLC